MALPDLLRAEGLWVATVAGWETRGRPGNFTPVGVMVHHTASRRTSGNAPSLDLVTKGRPDLPGPLCTLLVARDGLVFVVAAGRANHAGAGSSKVLEDVKRDIAPKGDAAALGLVDDITGNGWYYGIEVENDGVGELYRDEQITAVALCCAALCRPHGWTANRNVHHREHTRRKIDMSYRGDLRGMVAARLRPKEVRPMYDPPLPVAAVWQDEKGNVIAGVSPDGGPLCWGVPYRGGPNGKPYWGNRRAGAIRANPRHHENPDVYPHYIVVSTDGAEYGHTGF